MRHGAYILLVEDNPADSFLIRDALMDGSTGTRVAVAKDGEDAWRFLPRFEGDPERPRPDLIILDLNMPRKDGRTLLQEVKATPQLKCIPVVVLTSSEDDNDVNAAYSAFASAYFAKAPDLDELLGVLGRIKQYWLGDAKLPTRCVRTTP